MWSYDGAAQERRSVGLGVPSLLFCLHNLKYNYVCIRVHDYIYSYVQKHIYSCRT